MRAPFAVLVAGVLVAACKDKDGGDSGAVDFEGPTLAHEQPTGTFVAGDSVTLTVVAEDPDGVASVVAYFRTTGETYWDSLDLSSDGGAWTVELADLPAPGVDYYFKATDQGEVTATSFLPENASAAPLSLAVLPRSTPLPFVEEFEPTDDQSSLFAMDWWTPSDGFTGYAFELIDRGRDDSEGAAWHSRGVSGIDPLSDWLISPALDLSTETSAMVTWWELGAGTTDVSHGLYVSTGSRDPEDGDFVAVDEALPAPDGDEAWSRAPAVDLSDWVGEPVVYLAWRYRGQYADDWTIDDVWVRALAPDLDAALAWEPDPVHPGEVATVRFTLDNLTAASATGLTATLTLPEGGGSLAAEVLDVDDIPGLGTGVVEFELTVDADSDDNRYLPLELSLTDGVDQWDADFQMVVGQPSEAVVDVTMDDESVVSVVVGSGDPDAPDVSFTAWAGTLDAGTHSLPVDITDAFEMLPPAAGPNRWFARIDAGATGTVDAFAVTFAGDTTSATVLPAIEAGVPCDTWLPEPPQPVLVSIAPTDVEPGEADVEVTLTLTNAGAETDGPVTATVEASGDGVTVTAGGPFALTSEPWGADETVTLSGIEVDIDAAHDDSTPVQLSVLLDDGLESWTVEVELDVPWPVMKMVGILIDDSGGDGLLDPDETAVLDIVLANTGDLDSFGLVEGVLSLADTSTVTATVTSAEGYFGKVTSGGTKAEDSFAVEVTGGSEGDTLDLVLSLTDGTASYVATARIVLGESPWFVLATSDDDAGDNIGDYAWDYANGKYRVVDGAIELLLESYVVYDPATLFLEIWAEPEASDYRYYRWVLQSGICKFQGYTSGAGFSTLGTAEVEYPSTREVLLRWPVAEMAITSSSMTIGLAAGWCGPDEYYCDHFPDGWGYPYVSWSRSAWYSMSW